MIDVFSGGLVYEFTQEPNNYGLVTIEPNGDVKLLPDFLALKAQYQLLPEIDYSHVAHSMKLNAKEMQTKMKIQRHILPECEPTYNNLDISIGLPVSIADEIIEAGVDIEKGKFVSLSEEDLKNSFNILGVNGEPYDINASVEKVIDIMTGTEIKRNRHIKGFHNCTYNDFEEDVSEYFESSDSSDFSESEDEDHNVIYQLFQKASKYLSHLYNAVADKSSTF